MINPGPTPPADAILVVADANNQGVGELELEQVLERSLLFNLITFADDADKARDFDPGVVIISSSVNAVTLNDEWANEILPVIVMNDEVFPFMGMTDDGANDHDVDNDDTIDIEEGDHPIVAEFKGVNDILVSDNNIAMAIGSPDGDGLVIGSVGGGDDGGIFGYEFGDELAEVNNEDARIARHRRFGFFVAEGDVLELNADGETLLENTILFAHHRSLQPN